MSLQLWQRVEPSGLQMLASLNLLESPNTWLKVSSIAHDRSSQTSVVMLIWLSVLKGHSMVRWEVEGGVKVL